MEISGRLLGAPRACVSETWYDLPQTKASALLVYLAYSGEWVNRDELLYVFYPDSPEQPARSSFRQLLTAVRKLPYSAGLETEDNRLRWQLETDVAAFKTAVLQEKWAKALELYKSELLHGFQPHELSEFDNWLSLERQTLHSSWRKAGLTFAGELATTERHSLAAEVLASIYKADVLDEEILRVYLENLYISGQKGQALDIFTTFKNTLHHELSSEPEASTLELMALIQQDKPLSARGSVAVKIQTKKEAKPRHNLPTQPTPFVGRDIEKARLATLLADSDCRLVTIVAPGGMGKTRLAIEVARTQLEHFAGVCFVSFAAVSSPDLMVYALADALELNLFGSKPPKEQVLGYLKNKKMLLVLDNLEHLLSGVDLITEILATTSEIKILATSRERLGLQSEHLFDLYGLTVPDDSSSLQYTDALQLFAERTKHNRLDFVLEQHLQAVTRICQLVGGMPLAIELAASWSRLLNPEEIARELEQNLDILATATRDLPERHHSMRSVFEVSWQRLSDDEQTALRKLSVFQGGFTREAARDVTELDLPILLSLVNKSFLWRDTTGRFSQHPLILQYLQHKANDFPEEKNQFEEKHGLYYLELIKDLDHKLETRQGKEVRETVAKEFPNIRAAWHWAVRDKRVREIPRYARGLSRLLVFVYNRHAAIDMFRQVVAALDKANPEHHAALGYALIEEARNDAHFNADFESLTAITQHGLALLEPLGEYEEVVGGYTTLGLVAFYQSDYATCKEILRVALDLARTHGLFQDIAYLLIALVDAECESSSFDEVRALIPTVLSELRRLNQPLLLGLGLQLFGTYLVDNDRLKEGEEFLRESLELRQSLGDSVFQVQASLAELAYKRHDFSEAERLAREAHDIASQVPYHYYQTRMLAVLGGIKQAQDHLVEAEQLMMEGLRIGRNANFPQLTSHVLVFLAELNLAKGHVKQAVELLSFLCHFQGSFKRDRNEALKLLEKAKAHLSARDFKEAQEESKSLTLERIVTGILEKGLE